METVLAHLGPRQACGIVRYRTSPCKRPHQIKTKNEWKKDAHM